MRRSNRSAPNEDMCKCCLLPLLSAMGLALYGAIHFVIILDKFQNRMDRIADRYGNAINATTNSSACLGSLENFVFNEDNDREDCPTNEPCHDYCKNYFDVYWARGGPIVGMVPLFGLFAVGLGMLFMPEGLNFIENFRNFVSNCRRVPNRPDTYASLNDDVESLRFVGDGSVNTSLNSTRRFLTDQSRFHESQNASQPPYNKDEKCPITQEDIKDLNNPVVARDRYIYEREAIEKWLVTHDTSPMTNLPMGKTLISYNPNQESTDNQQQIVSAPRTLSRMLPIVTHTSSERVNEGKENTFTI